MELQKANSNFSNRKNRKMVHIQADTHAKIQQLALYTGKPINELVEMLLVDALSRVELVESEESNADSN